MKKVTATFIYEGRTGNFDEGIFQGTLINEVVRRQQEKAEKRGEWWSHFYPVHVLNGFSKADLWDKVKAAALQTRCNAFIMVKSGKEEKIIEISRLDG